MKLEQLKESYAYPDSKFIPLQGMDVHYRDVGEGPVIILIHGMFSSLHTWEHWIEKLSKDFRVIALDLPNYGLTGPHPKGMFKYIFSDFLDEFTDALSVESCMIAGNSLGGFAAWEFAVRYPKKVSKMILINSAGYFLIPPPIMLAIAMPTAGWIMSMIRLPRKISSGILKAVYGNKDRIPNGKLDLYHDLNSYSGNISASVKVIHYIRNRLVNFNTEGLKHLKQKTLVMWGDMDRWIPVSHAQRYCDDIPNSSKIIYSGAGHIPMEELPEKTSEDARKFFTSN